jgi:lipoprotein-anchoring transpeptidase ErfK/SrfK
MKNLLFFSLLLCTPAFADPLINPINAPRDEQLVASNIDPDITGTATEKEKRRAKKARQVRPEQQESDFSDTRAGAARPAPMGGGFIEFLFGGAQRGELPRSHEMRPWEDMSGARRDPSYSPYGRQQSYGNPYDQPRRGVFNPKYLKQLVEYPTKEKPGTIIIDTPNRFLYLVQEGGKAIRYGIGVGRPGFEWAGVKSITAKKEWPDWRPPKEMLARRPDLPDYMPGGPANPLGARAMYLGSTLYRIHGSNEPETIGTAVSSGCIRMRNEDVIDLYDRVPVGTKVIVI